MRYISDYDSRHSHEADFVGIVVYEMHAAGASALLVLCGTLQLEAPASSGWDSMADPCSILATAS